jgi:HK97 family phage major capsid protein
LENLIRINEIQARLDELEPLAIANSLTPEQRAELVNLTNELDRLEDEQRAVDRLKSRKLDAAKAKAKKEEDKLTERFSFGKVIRSLHNKNFTGAEKEVHEEGLKEAREAGTPVEGFALPSFVNKGKQERLLEARGLDAATAATAGNLIATDLYDMVPALRPMVKVLGMGATLWTGLKGNIDIPVGDAISNAGFNTETGNAVDTTPSTKLVQMIPKRLAAQTTVTLQMIAQGSIDVEAWILSELLNAEARAIDKVAIQGGGTNEPVGVLANAGVQVLALATNGANITRANLLKLEELLDNENASTETMQYLTTPGVKSYLKNLISSAGVSPFVWQDDNTILGYKAEMSNHVPKNLTKGTANGICHAVIFGDWSKLIIGNWGVRDVTLDNVTRAVQGERKVVINSFWDVQIPQPKCFSVIKDALI